MLAQADRTLLHERPRQPPTLFVVSGIQGVGKSTVARLLAERLLPGAWVSADALQQMIVSGGRWPEGAEMSPEAERQLRLRLHHACLLGASFVEAGINAVVDDIVIGERLEHVLAELAGRRFAFIMLTPCLDAVRERERGRGTQLWEQWAWLDEVVRTQTRRLGLWIDTSAQTPTETVETILARAWTEGMVEAPTI
ncbi:MAG: phosphotransferase [Chloroflexi bacterium]|nr:phosphotransferase [Chloroflexota bacterium]